MMPPTSRTLGQLLRVRHWVKNVLVFLPVITSHRVTDLQLLELATLAFVAFSLAASGAYVTNDIADAAADRAHPVKRERPVAAGAVTIPAARWLALLLITAAFGVALWGLPRLFLVSLASYVGLSTAYSLHLKRRVFLDVLVLAALYCVRIVGGGIATGVFVSPWLLAFSMFFFLSLALVKRYNELQRQGVAVSGASQGRGYVPADAEVLRGVGPVSGYLAALVLALYVNSEAASALYRSPIVLWLLVPLLIYWITRAWLLAHRGTANEDPVVFATEDAVTYLVGLLVLAILVIGTFGRLP